MKAQLPLTALLVLFGCGAPAPEQQSQSQVVEPSAVTTARRNIVTTCAVEQQILARGQTTR